jgi:NadR type nicotinamide-nucleotide adenylyltransferase
MPKKILVTGPESTGKSSLIKALSAYFNAPFVIEYARIYLSTLDRKYVKEDLLEMAKGQLALEEDALESGNELVFVDTDLTVIDIWSKEKFGQTDPWILEEMQKRAYDLYLVPDIDLEWAYDPQRENPDDRERLMQLYEASFKKRKIAFHKVRGQGEERIQNAIEIIKRQLNVES